MSFRTAAFIALLIGILAAVGFSVAVIAYTRSVEADARSADTQKRQVRTNAEINRIAEAVFHKHETAIKRSLRIRGDVRDRIIECRKDPACVRLAQRSLGPTREQLRQATRASVEAYCAQRDQCRGATGRRGAQGSRGASGAKGSTGATGSPGNMGSSGPSGRDGVIDSTLLNALDNRVRNLETSLGTLLKRLCSLLRTCQ